MVIGAKQTSNFVCRRTWKKHTFTLSNCYQYYSLNLSWLIPKKNQAHACSHIVHVNLTTSIKNGSTKHHCISKKGELDLCHCHMKIICIFLPIVLYFVGDKIQRSNDMKVRLFRTRGFCETVRGVGSWEWRNSLTQQKARFVDENDVIFFTGITMFFCVSDFVNSRLFLYH